MPMSHAYFFVISYQTDILEPQQNDQKISFYRISQSLWCCVAMICATNEKKKQIKANSATSITKKTALEKNRVAFHIMHTRQTEKPAAETIKSNAEQKERPNTNYDDVYTK